MGYATSMENLAIISNLNHIFVNIMIFIAGFLIGRVVVIVIETLPEGKALLLKNLFSTRFTLKGFIVQLITGAVFVLIYSKYGMTAEFFFFVYIMIILIIMFFIDLRTKIIPDELVIAGLAGGLVAFTYNIFIPLEIYPSTSWWEPLIGILPGSGVLLSITVLGMIIYKSDEVMGMGDVKIFAPVGMFLGWKMCMLTLVVSMFVGGITSIILVLFRIKKRKDTIPFGPFITLATLIVILFGKDIWGWYFFRI